MFEALGIASDLRPALVGAAFGTLATILVQYITHRYRLFMSFKRFKHDLRNLDRHIHASIESLNVPDGSPNYLIAARLRFCQFMDGMRSIEQLEWLTQRRDSARILPTLLAIRNSDSFLEEIANRIGCAASCPDQYVVSAQSCRKTGLCQQHGTKFGIQSTRQRNTR